MTLSETNYAKLETGKKTKRIREQDLQQKLHKDMEKQINMSLVKD